MSICRYCGQEITFRKIDGRCVPIHLYGRLCGDRLSFTHKNIKSSVQTRCPKCRQMVFLVRHNGGSVWLDELGWPWPRHGCFNPDNGGELLVNDREVIKVPLPPIWIRQGPIRPKAHHRLFPPQTVQALGLQWDHKEPDAQSLTMRIEPSTADELLGHAETFRRDVLMALISAKTPDLARSYIADVASRRPYRNLSWAMRDKMITEAYAQFYAMTSKQLAHKPKGASQRLTKSVVRRPPKSKGRRLVSCEFCKDKIRPDRLAKHNAKQHPANTVASRLPALRQ